MFPMIADPDELEEARSELEHAHASLESENVPHPWPIPVGIMIEVPSAALLVDLLAPVVDFVSIGTNDLTQYVLAADRDNPGLAQFQDALHPAVLRLISQVTTTAHQHRKPVGVCGEAASDPTAARLLVGLGVDELSLAPALIPKIKETIRSIDRRETQTMAAEAQRFGSRRRGASPGGCQGVDRLTNFGKSSRRDANSQGRWRLSLSHLRKALPRVQWLGPIKVRQNRIIYRDETLSIDRCSAAGGNERSRAHPGDERLHVSDCRRRAGAGDCRPGTFLPRPTRSARATAGAGGRQTAASTP